MNKGLAVFEGHEIRRVYDEETETWFFSVVDIVQVLTQQPDFQMARKYWNKLKERLGKEGSQLVTNCHRFKLPADDGKLRLTDVANAETLLRLVQSVPSPKAEPIKLWLAKCSTRQIAETTAATGMPENQIAAKTGGKIAKRARLELESKTGKSVVTGENFLPPGSTKRIRGAKDE